MKFLLKILLLWMALPLLFSCDSDDSFTTFHYDREVIAIFPPEGIETQTFSGLIFQGLYRVTDSLKVMFRPVLPATYELGLKSVSRYAEHNQPGMNRLVIVADPTYVDAMIQRGIADKLLDTDSTKVLVIGAYADHPKLYNAHIPTYGMMYKAGYIASQMNDVDSVKLFLATDEFAYYKEASDGFTQGYQRGGKNKLDKAVVGVFADDLRLGFNFSQYAYSLFAPNYANSFDLVMPICQETAMGFFRYNRDHPGAFYTVGMDKDMSSYSSDVPYSCVCSWAEVVVSAVADWNSNRLKHYNKYGLEENGTDIVAAEKFQKIIQPLSAEIHEEAIQKENEYAR